MAVLSDVHNRIHESVQDLSSPIIDLSLDIHRHPELALQEFYAADKLIEFLKHEEFTIESPLANLPTAFRGVAGSGQHPKIGYLLEYDALPKLGHACGHNLIAAGGALAAIALRRSWPDCPGTIEAIGTPGEEGAGGKITELKAGVFSDVDVAMMFHPGDRTWPWRHATAAVHLTVEFTGVSAHAAGSPQSGRNALASMIQFFVSVDGLRQHIPETSRLHGIITHGGDAPNIVPDYTRATFIARALTQAEALELVERVANCAKGAALASGTQENVEVGPPYSERKNNHTLASRVFLYLNELGVPSEDPVLKGGTGSSDIGNVSLVIPAIHPYLQIAPRGTPGHSAAFCEAAASHDAQVSMIRMGEALAHAGADFLGDETFRSAVEEEFRTSGADFPD